MLRILSRLWCLITYRYWCLDKSNPKLSPRLLPSLKDALAWLQAKLKVEQRGRVTSEDIFKKELERSRNRREVVALLLDPYLKECWEVTLPVSQVPAGHLFYGKYEVTKPLGSTHGIDKYYVDEEYDVADWALRVALGAPLRAAALKPLHFDLGGDSSGNRLTYLRAYVQGERNIKKFGMVSKGVRLPWNASSVPLPYDRTLPGRVLLVKVQNLWNANRLDHFTSVASLSDGELSRISEQVTFCDDEPLLKGCTPKCMTCGTAQNPRVLSKARELAFRPCSGCKAVVFCSNACATAPPDHHLTVCCSGQDTVARLADLRALHSSKGEAAAAAAAAVDEDARFAGRLGVLLGLVVLLVAITVLLSKLGVMW